MLTRRSWLAVGLLCGILPAGAATLEQLSMDDMIAKSTAVVRARVVNLSSARAGSVIYTVARLQPSEWMKGGPGATVDVYLPGGVHQGLRQTFSGAPTVRAGFEYLFFLWAGPSGRHQVIGLSQGLFDIRVIPAGNKAVAERAAITETMVNGEGQIVTDRGLTLGLEELRARIRKVVSEQ